MDEKKGYATKAVMFASLAKGGHLQVRELVDYPGVVISDEQTTRKDSWKRTIAFGDKEFETIGEAIEAWLKVPASDQESEGEK